MSKNISANSSNKASLSYEIYRGAVGVPPTDLENKSKMGPIRTMRNDILEATRKQEKVPTFVVTAPAPLPPAPLVTPPILIPAIVPPAPVTAHPAPLVALEKSVEKPLERVAKPPVEINSAEVPIAPRPVGRVFFIFALALIILGVVFLFKFLWPKITALEFPDIKMPGFNSSEPEKIISEKALVAPLTQPLIPTAIEKQIVLTISGDPALIFSAISAERTKELSENVLKNIFIVEEVSAGQTERKLEPISSNRFFMLTGIPTPEILTRSLEGPFMVGFMGTASAPAPFFILNVSSHDTGFIGMYEWEQNIPKFFDTVFGTNLDMGLVPSTKFRDVVILGQDARILEVAPGAGIAYMFANPKTIIMTTNKEILQKLVSQSTNR